MPDVVISLLNFLIVFFILSFVGILLGLSHKKLKLISVLFFYFFIASCFVVLAHFEIGVKYLNFYTGMGLLIDNTFTVIAAPFTFIYEQFFTFFIELCATFVRDVHPMKVFLLENSNQNWIFILSLHAVLFVLFALCFHKKKRRSIDNSLYKE